MKSKSLVISNAKLILVILSMVLAGIVYWTTMSNIQVHAQVQVDTPGGGTLTPAFETLQPNPNLITPTTAVLSGKVLDVGDDPLTRISFFRYTHDKTGSTILNVDAPGTYKKNSVFSYTDKGLLPGFTYMTYVIGQDKDSTVGYGKQLYFTTPGSFIDESPKASTTAATNIQPYSVTLNGSLDAIGNISAIPQFRFYKSPTSVNYAFPEVPVGYYTKPKDSISYTVVDQLSPSTTYTYKLCAVDYDGDWSCGNPMTFTTKPEGPDGIGPTVQSDPGTDVSWDRFTMHGRILDDAHEPDVAFFRVSTNIHAFDPSPSVNPDEYTVYKDLKTNDKFGLILIGVKQNTTYYYQACARDHDGDIGCGNVITTPKCVGLTCQPPDLLPEISTDSSGSITQTSATLVGKVTNAGNSPVTTYFQLSESALLANPTTIPLATTFIQGQLFSTVIGQLKVKTQYWFRACGKDSDLDNSCGAIMSFTTLPTVVVDPGNPTNPGGPGGPGSPGGPGGGSGGPGGPGGPGSPTGHTPTVDLSCSKNCTLPSPGTIKISWSNQYVKTCNLTTTLAGVGPFNGVDAISGFRTVFAKKSFDATMSCTGDYGPATDKVHVCIGIIGANGKCRDRNNPNFEEI